MSYMLPMFAPAKQDGYEWAGYVFAPFDDEYAVEFEDVDPVDLRERGIVADGEGRYMGSRFSALEASIILGLVHQSAHSNTVAMVVSLN